ncbi:hypothetical protein MKW98_005667 [Papaver atlanticum]|uniref:Uncharacterized protein n=1 Tax=Papaver atlanticum TaxID=357466 RepID=A0AAD4STE0_9MAGN|nr:hypothetical protein MKW98_005667 [Papaver atlanticum]
MVNHLTGIFPTNRNVGRVALDHRVCRFGAGKRALVYCFTYSAQTTSTSATIREKAGSRVIRFLLFDAVAANKTARLRSFHLISEIIMRLPNDAEVSDELWDEVIDCMNIRNAEVRKNIILSLPPTNATSATIIDCTLDVSESVRKAAYCVLANKFPLQSLSIRFRTIILQRGLADRSLPRSV